MPSKELLSSVLGLKSLKILNISKKEKIIEFQLDVENSSSLIKFYASNGYNINIYELAQKIKEWVITKGYYLVSSTVSKTNSQVHIHKSKTNIVIEHIYDWNETEAIIKAGEWVLNNKLK